MIVYIVLPSIPYEGLQEPVAAFTSEPLAEQLAEMLQRNGGSEHVVHSVPLDPFTNTDPNSTVGGGT